MIRVKTNNGTWTFDSKTHDHRTRDGVVEVFLRGTTTPSRYDESVVVAVFSIFNLVAVVVEP